jgi:hypothetical protein
MSVQGDGGWSAVESMWSANMEQHFQLRKELHNHLKTEVSRGPDDSHEIASLQSTGRLERLKDKLTSMKAVAGATDGSLHQVEEIQNDVMLRFHSAYALTSEEYPEVCILNSFADYMYTETES